MYQVIMAQGNKLVIGGLNLNEGKPTIIKCHEILYNCFQRFQTVLWCHKLDCSHWSYHQPQRWKKLTFLTSKHCFKSLKTNEHKNLINAANGALSWITYIASFLDPPVIVVLHGRQTSAFEKTKLRLLLFILLKI